MKIVKLCTNNTKFQETNFLSGVPTGGHKYMCAHLPLRFTRVSILWDSDHVHFCHVPVGGRKCLCGLLEQQGCESLIGPHCNSAPLCQDSHHPLYVSRARGVVKLCIRVFLKTTFLDYNHRFWIYGATG